MALNPGDRIGAVEILGSLGAGGMGEVYRGLDTRLRREVAVKVLPDAFASDADRLARFEREAHLLASLNHPHIAQVFGLEESGSAHALVMELVEGPDLEERLAPGPLPVADAIAIARQIAEALDAAHQRGIVHRDLKPANIKVRSDGTVKVLDFGLAVVRGGAGAGADTTTGIGDPQDAANTTVQPRDVTRPGMVVGTVRYMSPEQAAGLPVDTRTDIWAFGCVLYEMLAGQQPFRGRTNMETLASVIKGEPDWTGLARIPPGVARVVLRCLQKDLRQRFQHIVDVRLALDDALSMADADAMPASVAPRKPWALAAIVAAAAVTAGAGGTFLLRPAARAEAGVVRFEIAPPATQPFDGRPPGLNFAISPAGSTVVYHATVGDDVQLVRRDLDSVQGTPIPGTARAQSPTFSPDGRQLAFYADGAIRTVPVTGGSPIVVCEWPGLAPFLAWLDTGDIGIAAPRELLTVPATGGVPRTLVTASAANDEGGFFGVSGLPGGGLLTLIVPAPGGRSRVRLGALAPGASALKIIIDDGSPAGYGEGHLLLTRQGKFIAVPFNPERLEATGQPIVLENDPQHQFAVAQNGAYITVAEDPGGTDNPARARLEWLTGDQSRGHVIALDLQNARHPRVSPDGTRLAVVTGGLNYGSIWIYDLVRPSQPIKITFRGGAGFPIWRPDGRAVTFTLAGPDQALGLYSVASDGSQLEPTKVLDQYPVTPEDFRADGSALLYAAVSARSGSDLLLLDTATGRTRPWLQTPFNEGEARFSPDGRLVAYVSDQTGRSEIWLRSFEGAASLVRVSSDGGHEPRWSPDGRQIYFQSGGNLLVAAVEPSPTLRVATARVVESGLIPFNTYFRRSYDVAPDGRVVAARMTATPSSGKLVVVLHALESLGQ